MNRATELVLFNSCDGEVSLSVAVDNETVWLTLDQISALFQRDKSTISRHIRNVFLESELNRSATVAKFATVRQEGNRQVERQLEYYSLEAISTGSLIGWKSRQRRMQVATTDNPAWTMVDPGYDKYCSMTGPQTGS